MTKWSHLPNAKHIDAVIASIKANPKAWCAARGCPASRVTAWHAAREAARGAAWEEAFEAACEGLTDMVPDGSWAAARHAARDSILALVAYDHAGKYIEMTSDQLRAWATLSEDPAAILLIPAVGVMDNPL